MVDSVAFRTRARTIDHLGREQIADCPTAVSELWKNAYDAYARNVALNIYSAAVPIATVLDDGHGMNRQDFEAKWLVIGTESKATDSEVPEADRNGLPIRTKQGQKGIGRLSSAYLGSLLLLISKRKSSQFVASMVDWRLFENPFIYLNDIEIPVVEFDEPGQLWSLLPALFERLMGNVWGNGKDRERDARLVAAWSALDKHEEAVGRVSTRAAIEKALIDTEFDDRHLLNWPAWRGESESGTALLMAHLVYDLEAQLEGSAASGDNDTAKQARDKLLQTLVNFTDPFVDPNNPTEEAVAGDFSYSATAWDGDLTRIIISSSRIFSYENLEELEHVIEGSVDDTGRFVGNVKAFGNWLDGQVVIPALVPIANRADAKVGAFHIRIGTFEQLHSRSTLQEAVHSQLSAQVDRYGGFMVFRNGLRVMPYGRVDNDFFEIEQRRSKQAGREFWSNRRMFGRIALTRDKNPNLRDKAGREGLIDNRAAKIFRDVVTNILMTAARRYFGMDSEIRSQRIPEIEENYKQKKAEEAQQKIRARKRREFRKNLELGLPKMLSIEYELINLAEMAHQNMMPESEEELIQLRKKISDLKSERSSLTLGTAPKNLAALETNYTEFKRASAASSDLLNRLTDSISYALEKVRPQSASEAASAELNRNAAYIQGRLRRWAATAREIVAGESERIAQLVDERSKRYQSRMLPLLAELDSGEKTLPELLDNLELEREKEDFENSEIFESYISTLRNLQEQVDLDSLVTSSIDEVDEIKVELNRLNALAQLGITVEIIGHEMDGLETTISRGLEALPASVKESPPYQSALTAHRSLVDKLRFLSPLKLSGDRIKEWISGQQVADYIRDFMGESLERQGISLVETASFRRFSVYDQASRIYPVFINLVNNAAYWVDQSRSVAREILLDTVSNGVIVADSGPGVEKADVRNLFSLFFTRKIRSGRGVGLYLCRANLAASGHKISYISEDADKKLPGANFVIDFKGAKYD